MADNVVTVVFKAVTDQFKSAMSGLVGEMQTFADTLQPLLRGDIRGFASQMARVYGPVGAVYGGTALLAGGLFNAAKNFSDTGIEVGKFADALGITAEQASPLYELASDLNIPIGALEMAAKKLAQQGLPLTTEALGDLAEEYLGLEDPASRVAFLTDHFGRSGQDLATALQLGKDKLYAYHQELGAGQMFTQQEIDNAWKLHDNLDRLGDIWDSTKLGIGGVVAEPLADWLQGVNEGWDRLRGISSLKDYFDKLGVYLKGVFGPIIDGLAKKLRDLREAFLTSVGAANAAGGRASVYGGITSQQSQSNQATNNQLPDTLNTLNNTMQNLPFTIRDAISTGG